MRIIIHLSDLHFGHADPELLPPLLSLIKSHKPDVIVVSGDFTQRAKVHEYRQAQTFLSHLPAPLVCVPGNHDIPLYRAWERLSDPYKNYRKFISPILEPSFVDDEIAIRGINSVRASHIVQGRVNQKQLQAAQDWFSSLPGNLVKIIVTHHPFNVPANQTRVKPVGRAKAALRHFHENGIDLLLAGHWHAHMHDHHNAPYRILEEGPLIVHAGSAISDRLREEPNSFNVIRVDNPLITVERFERILGNGYISAKKLEVSLANRKQSVY